MWWSERVSIFRPRQRVTVLRSGLLLALAVGLLTGCGFALRQLPPLPFERIALSGLAERSPLGQELREQLAQSVQVVATPAQAQVLLQVLTDRREKSVVASTAAGQVRELQLRTRLGFRLSTPDGRELIPATELALSRDISYSETFALAKAQEEADLYAAMQTDLVQQLLRRLARTTPGPAAPVAVR